MWTLIDDTDWNAIYTRFPWVQDMVGIPQDPIHHAEGDVAVHTRMVLEALLNISAFQNLGAQNQAILIAAALLHDVEKRSTTKREEDGRITSRGHAKKGASTTQRLLFAQYNAPFAIRQKIVALVRYHGLPLWAFEKRDPIPYLLKAGLSIEMPLLKILAEADVKGRICRDQRELLFRLDLFQAFCEEQQCWEQSPTFSSDWGRFQYLNGKGKDRYYTPYEKEAFPVILLAGLPGMGKDTFIKNNYLAWPIVSLDEIRKTLKVAPGDKKATGKVVQIAKEKAKEYLRKKQPFVWNATNLTADIRYKLIDLFQTYGAKTKLVYLEAPFDKWSAQNRNRVEIVPNIVLDRMMTKWEVPQIWEAPEVDYVISEH